MAQPTIGMSLLMSPQAHSTITDDPSGKATFLLHENSISRVQVAHVPALPTPPKEESPPALNVLPNATASKKRKREINDTTNFDKRIRIETPIIAELKSQEARSGRSSRESSLAADHACRIDEGGLRKRTIERHCVAEQDGNFDCVSCFDIVRKASTNFKTCMNSAVFFFLRLTGGSDFRNYQDPFDQSFTVQYLPKVELEYPNDGAKEM